MIVRDLKKKKIDPDDFSSDEEIGMPESIRMSDQKVAQMAAAQDGSRLGFIFLSSDLVRKTSVLDGISL